MRVRKKKYPFGEDVFIRLPKNLSLANLEKYVQQLQMLGIKGEVAIENGIPKLILVKKRVKI